MRRVICFGIYISQTQTGSIKGLDRRETVRKTSSKTAPLVGAGFLLVGVLLAVCQLRADHRRDTARQQALSVADAGFAAFIDRALANDSVRRRFGLNATDGGHNASLGTPLPLFVMAPQQVERCLAQGCQDVTQLSARSTRRL